MCVTIFNVHVNSGNVKREQRAVGTRSRDEIMDLPSVKGAVKDATNTTFAHLCTPLTRDKFWSLTTVSGGSSDDKGHFCHAFNPHL